MYINTHKRVCTLIINNNNNNNESMSHLSSVISYNIITESNMNSIMRSLITHISHSCLNAHTRCLWYNTPHYTPPYCAQALSVYHWYVVVVHYPHLLLVWSSNSFNLDSLRFISSTCNDNTSCYCSPHITSVMSPHIKTLVLVQQKDWQTLNLNVLPVYQFVMCFTTNFPHNE